MDVPYDPACPLLIDSDDESIASGDEDIVKKYDDLISRKLDGQFNQIDDSNNSFGNKNEARFVPAFEDDNEELLNYCLKESGFLTDDDMELEEKNPTKGESNIVEDANEDEMLAKVESASRTEIREKEKKKKEEKEDSERQTKSQRKKKKKYKTKEKSKERKEKKNKHASLDSPNEKKHRRDSVKKERDDKIDKNLKHKMDDKESKFKIHSAKQDGRNIKNNDDGFDDDDDIFASLSLDDDSDAFPLSKVETTLEKEKESCMVKVDQGKNKEKQMKDSEDKERSHSKNKKRQREENSKMTIDERKSKKKRKRSKSSHRKSESSESDEPEIKKMKKKKHKEKSSDKDEQKRKQRRSENVKYERGRSEAMKHERKRKDKDEIKEEKDRKEKKKKKTHDQKDDKKSPHKERNHGSRKDSENLSLVKSHSDKPKHERRKHHENESKMKSKEDAKKIDKKDESEKNRRENDSAERRRKHFEGNEKDLEKSIAAKTSKSENIIKPEKEDESKTHRKVTSKRDIVSDHIINKSKIKLDKEKTVIDSDTDSEFERLSDIEREIEKEKSDSKFSSPEKSALNKNDVDTEVPRNIEKSNDNKISKEQLNRISNKLSTQDNSDIEKEENEIEMEKPTVKEITRNDEAGTEDVEKLPSSRESQEKVSLAHKNATVNEKRPFKLLSKEETKKLQDELLSKEKHVNTIVEVNEEEMDKEASIEMKDEIEEDVRNEEENLNNEQNTTESDNEDANNDEMNIDGQQNTQKTKDDLFDDIFAKEVSEDNDDYDLAKMYEKVEDTSPKSSSYKKQKSTFDKNQKLPKTDEKEINKVQSPKKTPNLKLEDGKFMGKKTKSPRTKSPKAKSPQGTLIPGLEPISIPGLESTKKKENIEISEKVAESKTSSKIPLLFDDDARSEKSDGIAKTPEFSPSDKKGTKKKQPCTPPEEFTGEQENNQFDRYYHLEASDSPYNPEDLAPIDMGLSPSDANVIQQEALKGAVELKLKDPFSGFENPTWQKIIEAKSKHEVKRQRFKAGDSNEKVTEGKSKVQPKLFKEQKFVNTLVRQSRVEQECKQVLKLYYKSKEITKDEYKEILRKAVPQVTMSNSPIIPEKIRSLMKKFVCKCKGQRLLSGNDKPKKKEKRRVHASTALGHALTFPGEKRFRYLNPDLPMPPV